jgi:DNA-binding transcriptional LysR family regulator
MNLRKFDLNLLVALDALMRERNVSRAADSLFIGQSAMSHALNRLRELLDDPVLVRTAEGMRPTTRALEIIGPVREALQQIEDVISPPERFDPAKSARRFVISASDYIEYLIIPPLMERVFRAAPGIDFHIVKPEQALPEQDLEAGTVAIALGFTRDMNAPKRLRSELLFEDERVCVVRKEHPEIKRTLSLQQYLKLEHIRVAPSGKKTGVIDEWLAARGLKRRIALIVPHFLYAPYIVSTTDMILAPPLRIARQFTRISPLKTVPMPIDVPHYQISMVWSPVHDRDPGHCWLREQVRVIAESISEMAS